MISKASVLFQQRLASALAFWSAAVLRRFRIAAPNRCTSTALLNASDRVRAADFPGGWHSLVSMIVAVVVFGGMPIRADDSPPAKPLDLLLQTLSHVDNSDAQANILRGMDDSLKGRHGLTAPDGWDALYEKLEKSPNEEVRRLAQALGVCFGAESALGQMRKTLADESADRAARQSALESLVAAKDAKTLPLLLTLATPPGPLRGPALRGLADYDDPKIAGVILGVFKTLDTSEKRDALNALLARRAGARDFLAAIDAGTFTKSEINAPAARQLQDLHDSDVDAWLAKNWGAVRTSPADKQAQIARMKKFLSADSILHADASRGRALFTQTCALCHTLFGYGAKIGPELPGSFEDVDYLLLNIVDPDAIIGKDYQQVLVHTKDGQTLSGIIAADDPNSVTLKSLAGQVTVQRTDIASMEVSPHSLMPEGLITGLDQQSVRDLFLYLRQRGQVPMLATPVNSADFFDGNDLARWQTKGGDWKIENGELVGHGAAAKTAVVLSEMVADKFELTMQVKVSGADAIAELAFWGRPDLAPFHGWSLSLGGATPPNLWLYNPRAKLVPLSGPAKVTSGEWVKVSITSHGGNVTGTVGPWDFVMAKPPEHSGQSAPSLDVRSGFAFYLRGKDAELQVKDVKLEVAPK
ncbi:MAG TPA: family 16 glycoside hydrolase [Chthoniobacter sp.]|jgi:putative heme-binding domain-containing protein